MGCLFLYGTKFLILNMQLSKNNYIRRDGHGCNFTVSIDQLPVATNYFTASLKAAEEVYNQRQGKMYLMYSGGVDSEYALSTFIHLKMDVTPVIIQLGHYNDFDTKCAFDFCESRGLKPIVIDIDFDHFVESGKILELAYIIKSDKYQRCATAHAIGMLDGTVLCGDGEPYIKLDPETKKWNITIYEHDYAVANYYEKYGVYGTPHFNRWHPEMFLSFFLDPRITDLANNTVPGKLSSESSKFIIYNRNSGFNLKERPKYHGYETIENSPISRHENVTLIDTFSSSWGGVYSTDYFKFIENYVQPKS